MAAEKFYLTTTMRVAAVCLVFAFAVLTALPDTTGAPASDEALVSGSKALTESSQSTQCEEEQEHVSQEKATKTGTTKVDHSVKKKVSVKNSEQQHWMIYYVVSYKKLPKQKNCETKDEYYKRVFPKEDNLKVFYRKVFKCYEGEEPSKYIERVEYIFTNIYPELDCRLDVSWLEQFDHYYTLKCSRKYDEPDHLYYARILKKLDGECNETYKKRMECLVAALDEEDFSHITFDDSALGYVVGERKTPCTSVSTPESTAQVTGTTSTTVKSKSSEVDVDKSVTSVETATDSSRSTATEKKLHKKETSVEKETTTTSSSYKVAYVKMPDKEPGEPYEVYYKKFFGTYDDNVSQDELNECLLRMFIMYKNESPCQYCSRIDYLLDFVYPKFDVRFDKKMLPLTEYYFRLKYKLQEEESEKDWFHRVLLKEQDESAEHYKKRVEIINAVFKSANWSLVSIDENCTTGYTFVSESESSYSEKSLDSTTSTIYVQRGVNEAINEEEIKKTYAKKDSEDYLTYYKRLTEIDTKTTEEYIETVTSIRKCFTELDLWYDLKYIEYTKKYYSKLFDKLSCESHEQYFERIIKKYSFETDVQCAKRIEIIQHIYSSLELWSNFVYYEKFTKVIYQSLYSKRSSENDTSYYERITQKLTGECDLAYVNRLRLIKLTHCSLDLWYNKTYLYITSKYYTIKYNQGNSEKITSYYERIVKKETEETDEQCACRAELLRYLFPNLDLWHQEKYYELYTKLVYQLTYSKHLYEDDMTYYKRITEQSSGEADIVYINRMYLVKRTFNSLPLWYSREYLSLTNFYYTKTYTKSSTEKVDVYYKRIVEKEALETDEQCANRVEIIHCLFPALALWHDQAYYNTLTMKIFQIIYKKKTTEDEKTYYSRLVSQLPGESDSVYLQRMSLVKRTTNSFSIWYSTSYLNLSSKYYIPKYAKADNEEWEDVYERIVAKEFDETDEQCAHRVEVIRNIYPNLPLWSLLTYYVKYIKKHYTIIYEKKSSEDERSYFARICTKFPQESDLTYVGRLDLVLKTYSTLSLWHNSEYMDLLYNYIKIKYAQYITKSDEDYIGHLVAKVDCDTSDLIYAQRIHLIHQLTVSSATWYSEKMYDAYTKLYYTTYYAKGEDECCETWLKRVITQLDGECDESAIKRIALIKKSTSECGCWTEEILEKLKSSFTSDYCENIKNLFCITYSETTTVSSSSSVSESDNSSEEIVITRG